MTASEQVPECKGCTIDRSGATGDDVPAQIPFTVDDTLGDSEATPVIQQTELRRDEAGKHDQQAQQQGSVDPVT